MSEKLERNQGLKDIEQINTENPLAKAIEFKIVKDGPMPFDEYMKAWNDGMVNENDEYVPGFYNSSDTNIGGEFSSFYEKSGKRDFTTLPEITPLYGFLLAKQIKEMWEKLDRDENFRIVEMGAGNGTMADDILHGLRYFAPDMKVKYTIVEQSGLLAEKQRQKLADFDVDVIEASAVDTLPQNVTGVFISNELLDDLPAKMVRNIEGKWEELFIGLEDADKDRFKEVWKEADERVSSSADSLIDHIKPSEVYPLSLTGDKWIKRMSSSLERGFIITADYFKYDGSSSYEVYSNLSRGVEVSETGNIDHLNKNNSGKGGITSAPNFREIHISGQEAGLKTEVDVTVGGFSKSLGSLDLAKELWSVFLEEKPFSECKVLFGFGREYDRYTAPYHVATSGYRMLIQSKNVESANLSSGKFRFADEVLDLEIESRNGFRQVDA